MFKAYCNKEIDTNSDQLHGGSTRNSESFLIEESGIETNKLGACLYIFSRYILSSR